MSGQIKRSHDLKSLSVVRFDLCHLLSNSITVCQMMSLYPLFLVFPLLYILEG